ncbi:MAG TPA: ParB/RepB/Spo0J family partition protein [Kofleriaceae bacterium]|nr:ParB/RepB/Spo0J family partition protein [Kofleriaceae bacterium]
MTPDPKDKKRGLGRGLGALMPSMPGPGAAGPGAAPPAATAAPVEPPGRPRTYFQAPIEDVYPSPDQPRRHFAETELDELAQSIRAHGVIMPLIVRARPDGGYLLIAGERRWRASQRAGLHEVPVVIQDVDPREAFERALVENLQRSDLNPIEEAAAYQRLFDEFGLTQEQVAERVGKERSTVANAVRLLKLPTAVRAMVEDRRLSMGHARALLGLDEPAAIETAARAAITKGLSVRATEKLVRDAQDANARAAKTSRAPRAPAGKSAAARDLEERLTKALGGPVELVEDHDGKKSGTITIRYLDLDHLDRLLEKLL